jgi:hypothetical protein
MKNVSMKIEGKVLKIEINLDVPGMPSKTGKSVIIASTEGNKSLPGNITDQDFKIGLNVYRPRG